jgi:hypothetical protein
MQLNVCFDTDNHTTILLQAPSLDLSNREIKNEKNIQIEFIEKDSPIINDLKQVTFEQEQSPLTIIENRRS